VFGYVTGSTRHPDWNFLTTKVRRNTRKIRFSVFADLFLPTLIVQI
jgi:hypothetical protein